jgi:hypothetical protein
LLTSINPNLNPNPNRLADKMAHKFNLKDYRGDMTAFAKDMLIFYGKQM